MADSLIWGTFGGVVFEFLTSPEYGSFTRRKSAKFEEHDRIVSRLPNGQLAGQKPVKEINGLDLDTINFTCKISSIILQSMDLSLGAALAGALGVGSIVPLGEFEDDERFNGKPAEFADALIEIMDSQRYEAFSVGERFFGLFTIDGLDMTEKHKKDGELLHIEIRLDLKEWID